MSGRARQLDSSQLRPGWTTGACAAAAAKAAWIALNTGGFPDPVEIVLPGDRVASFALTLHKLAKTEAMAAVTKDAGDDPDVTHGAIIRAMVRRSSQPGVSFIGGTGVGTVTRPGLPLEVGQPAINPLPRRYIADNLATAGFGSNVVVEISVDDGEEIARHTWNSRIGIMGGISILGTTGVVVPYSCSAWIASIREGIDVARASGATHVAGCTGSTSEKIVSDLYPGIELIDMGDFVGAVLKYLAQHPIDRLTICGGFAKISKLAKGHLDLHSHRTSIDVAHLAQLAQSVGADHELALRVSQCNTARQALDICQEAGVDLGAAVAQAAQQQAQQVLGSAPVSVEIICTGAEGTVVARSC